MSRADRFSLLVAVCDVPAERDRAIQELRDALPDPSPAVVRVPEGATDLLEIVTAEVGSRPQRPVMIVGLEKAVPSRDPEHPILGALNLRRGEWPTVLPVPVVLWVPSYLVSLLSQEAPDFMDWRSDTVHLPVLTEREAAPLYRESWRGGTDGSLSAEARRERIEELQSRLRSYEHAESARTKEAVSRWMSELGNHFSLLGDLDDAERMHRRALELEEDFGRKEGMAIQYGNFGLVHQSRGDLDEAERMFRRALELNEELGGKEGMASDYGNLGLVHRSRGDLDEAERMFRRALELNEELGRKEGMAIQYGNLGRIHADRGEMNEARMLWERARDLYAKIGASHMAQRVEAWLDQADSGETPRGDQEADA